MMLGELIRVLPPSERIEVRVIRNGADITIAQGISLEIKEVLPIAKNKLKVIVE